MRKRERYGNPGFGLQESRDEGEDFDFLGEEPKTCFPPNAAILEIALRDIGKTTRIVKGWIAVKN